MFYKGFSFIELIITLMILGILSCFSLPFLGSLYKKNQLNVEADELKHAIQYAKIIAVAGNKTVKLKPYKNDWSLGMILVTEKDEKILNQWQFHESDIKISWAGFESEKYIRFSPNLASQCAGGHFVLQDKKNMMKVVVNRLGNVA